jgi:toxin ParE1/3/4
MKSSDRLPSIWSPLATADVVDIWERVWLATSAVVADKQLQEIFRVCFLLGGWPQFGKARDDVRKGVRSVRAGRYVVFYRVTRSAIEIVRVLDERRDIDSVFEDNEK